MVVPWALHRLVRVHGSQLKPVETKLTASSGTWGPAASPRSYAVVQNKLLLNLRSTQNNGPYPKIVGMWSIVLGSLEVQVCAVGSGLTLASGSVRAVRRDALQITS